MLAAAVLTLAACTPEEPATAPPPVEAPSPGPTAAPSPSPSPDRVDPREDGFRVDFGEFAVTLEAPAIRPGPVTFTIHNGGELTHGFEMELEDDSSGPGGGDRFKIETETFGPGETIRLDLDLEPGLYKIECFVANHDDLGMEALLEVREDAPLVRPEGSAGDTVAIRGFAFEPPSVRVTAGNEVVWTNEDPAEHTVTAENGGFDSGTLSEGDTFSHGFAEPGRYPYRCVIHPSMTGTIVVSP